MHHIHQSWLGNYFVILPQNIIKIYWSLFPTNNCFIIEIETTWLKGLWLGWMALRPPWQREEGPAASPWKRGPGLPGKQRMLRAANTELLLQSHRAPSSRTLKPAKAEEGRWRHRPAHWNQHLVEPRWRGGPAQSWLAAHARDPVPVPALGFQPCWAPAASGSRGRNQGMEETERSLPINIYFSPPSS